MAFTSQKTLGGSFDVDIRLNDYPLSPPKMKFITRIYHPNMSSQTGAICLDILKNKWSPVYTLRTVLLSLTSLLSDPVPEDPQDAEVAKVFMASRADFDRTAREWTQKYAVAAADGVDAALLEKFLEMGFPEKVFDDNFYHGAILMVSKKQDVREHIIACEGDEAKVMEKLIGS
jgi:ubiquitin-conjugating enzyme (huntingtin interacting protein 2)